MRMTFIALAVLLIVPCISNAETIDVQIKGVDDGVRTTKQQDYKEAVLFAKREAIERAGVKIKALTTVKDMVVNSDYIESKAEAALMPGYQIMDIGYQADLTYLVILIGKVKTVSETIDSKELRYAKSLYDMGEKSDAKKIIDDILKDSKDDNTVAETMYCMVLWKFSSDPAVTYIKLKAYYPDSKYVVKLKNLLDEIIQKYGVDANNITKTDGQFYAFDNGIVLDTKTGLMWASKDNGSDINWSDSKRYCENYTGGSYTDWRLPTQDELARLYDPNRKNRDGYYLTKLIDTTKCCLWALETRGSEAAYFDFNYGSDRGWESQAESIIRRVLPVRSGK